jgi:hypothetical protein
VSATIHQVHHVCAKGTAMGDDDRQGQRYVSAVHHPLLNMNKKINLIDTPTCPPSSTE